MKFSSQGHFKALLLQVIFLATCFAILLQHKLHESLLSVTCPEMNVSRNFFVAAISLREVEVGSTSCNKNVARHVPFRAPYTRQQFVQLVSQRHKKKKMRDKLQEKLPSV